MELHVNGAPSAALVDAEDHPLLSRHRWFLLPNGYVVANIGGQGSTYLHRLVLPARNGLQVDHINLNKLDNRKENLRLVSPQQNSRNSPKRSHSKQPYKGISGRPNGRWVARITGDDGRHRHIGSFGSAEEAARAYDAEARRIFGEHAHLNFPEEASCLTTNGSLTTTTSARSTSALAITPS